MGGRYSRLVLPSGSLEAVLGQNHHWEVLMCKGPEPFSLHGGPQRPRQEPRSAPGYWQLEASGLCPACLFVHPHANLCCFDHTTVTVNFLILFQNPLENLKHLFSVNCYQLVQFPSKCTTNK